MKVLGLCVSFSGRPVVRGVVLAVDPQGNPVVVDKFTHSAIQKEPEAQQLHKIHEDLATKIAEYGVDLTVIRLRDQPPRPQRPPVVEIQRRAMVDGVLLAAASKAGVRAEGLPGVEVARKCGKPKADVERDAENLVGSSYRDAGTAALAALAII